ncbi:MAG: DUF262 domain-containing protein [Alphaproteobacteria bacterium]|nr:DUF262 domain-containing protein [Alphaproteobacteria bacterium]
MKKIHSDQVGIGRLLKQTRFTVPPHQRSYSWTGKQVDDLYRDIKDAEMRQSEEYSLGTIVLAGGDDGRLRIIDGQQRLVTVSILLAAIRDYFAENGQTERAQDIEWEFLSKRDIRTQESVAQLHLIEEDRDFFIKRAVLPPGHPDRATEPSNSAQERIAKAITHASSFLRNLTETTQTPDDILLDFLEFIENRALLISVTVEV